MAGSAEPEVDAVVAVAGTAVSAASVRPPLPPAAAADIAQFVALRAAACVGADYSNFALIDPRHPTVLRLFHGASLDAEIAARYVEVPIEAPFPIAAAVRDRRVVMLSGSADYLAQFPEIWDDTRLAGIEATVSVPLSRSDGSPIGAIGFAWSSSPDFDVRLDNALEAVGHLVTEIVERAELYEVEHRLIADLHRRLLSDLPATPGLATAARYTPAGRSGAIGGDWFEGLHLDNGTFAVVVGDVTGHGLAAAADMALIRGLITALLHDGVPVADVFARVSRILARRADKVLATAAVAVIDAAAATITYATAGHPPPLLIQPDGGGSLLDRANAPLLGIARSRQVSMTTAFPRGATLIMYTDGLVEARDRPFSDGIDQAVQVLAREPVPLPPERYVELLVDALVGGRPDHDDLAVVVVQHTDT